MKKLLYILLFVASHAAAQNHYVVTSSNDPLNPFNTVAGELRWALEQANASPGLDYIDFNIPGTAPHIIQLKTDLPAIKDAVVIDGATQPANGYTGAEPKVWVKGDKTNPYINFAFNFIGGSSGSTVKNMLMYDCSYILLMVFDSGNNTFENNVIHTSESFGPVYMGDCDGNLFYGNILGTDHTLSTSSALSIKGGFRLQINHYTLGTPDNNKLGGLGAGQPNFFYNMPNMYAPLDIQNGTGNFVSGNIFINNAKNIDIYTNVNCPGNNCKQPPVIQLAASASGSTLIQGTSAPFDHIEIYKTNATNIDAVQLIGVTTANSSGQWSMTTTQVTANDKVIGTATDTGGNTSEFTKSTSVTGGGTLCCSNLRFLLNGRDVTSVEQCEKDITVQAQGCECDPQSNSSYSWNFGDNSPSVSGCSATHSYLTPGTYTVTVTYSANNCIPAVSSKTVTIKEDCDSIPCTDCIGSFAPEPGKKYVISAWVKEENASITTTSYTNQQLTIEFPSLGTVLGPFPATGAIIDGWQRIEAEFQIPLGAHDMAIKLNSLSGNVYFDDIRVFPVDGSMKSYVYDPVTMRLSAELDERNYATFYEYDEEGKLHRVKKETERGIMTIQENKNSSVKKQ